MPFMLPTLGIDIPFDAVIDVRSPAEFAEDHIPGALNLPALTNNQRADIGTIYVKESRFTARRLGAAMVARNVAAHLEGALAEKPADWRPLVYCWRGGQRSGSVATILRQIGWQAETIDGGYRSYRRIVQSYVYDQRLAHQLVLIDGGTGTGKTEILNHLQGLGAQVIDLEGLAHHRGSLFGDMLGGQPSQKSFETKLAAQLSKLDPERSVFVEAESSKIGDRVIPPSMWAAMRASPRITISASLESRAKYTLRAYCDIAENSGRLTTILTALTPYHGAIRIEVWRAMVDDGQLQPLVEELMESHYDPRYQKSTGMRGIVPAQTIHIGRLDDAGFQGAAKKIMQTAAGLDRRA